MNSELPALKYSHKEDKARERSPKNIESRQENHLRAFYLLEPLDMKVLKSLNAMTDPSLLPLMLKYNNKS